MRVLYSITSFTTAKDYVHDAFVRMAEACIAPYADIRVYGDRPIGADRILGSYPHIWIPLPGHYADDMLINARQRALEHARMDGYDALVWAGVDALFETQDGFKRLLDRIGSIWGRNAESPILAPLIPARMDANKAVCRHFDWNDQGEYLETQHEVAENALESGELVDVAGFPGADNLILPAHALKLDIMAEDYIPWYERVKQGLPNLCCEEWWCLKALRSGKEIYCDSSVKVWHVHEDGTARLWKGIERPVGELTW